MLDEKLDRKASSFVATSCFIADTSISNHTARAAARKVIKEIDAARGLSKPPVLVVEEDPFQSLSFPPSDVY